jgi:hypothetical protein
MFKNSSKTKNSGMFSNVSETTNGVLPPRKPSEWTEGCKEEKDYENWRKEKLNTRSKYV